METLCFLAEIAATMTESAIALATVTNVCKPRYQGWKNFFCLSFFTVLLTSIVLLLNTVSLFSYLTPIVAILYVALIASHITSHGSILTRLSFCIFSYTVIQVFDYITLILFGLSLGVSETVYTVFIEPTTLRASYVLAAKLCDVILYLIFRPFLRKIEKMSMRLQVFFFLLSFVTYIFMQFLFSTIISTDLAVMQSAVVFSWLFLLCFVIAVLALFSFLTKSERDKQTQLLLQSENKLMTENYQLLHAAQKDNARQLHDFRHHLSTIQSLDSSGKREELSNYVESLLKESYSPVAVCHSGNDIIDAIINHKVAEAREFNIDFRFTANFHVSAGINSIDICGILANQIDNAFDACRAIPNDAARQVIVNISQREGFAFFKVENTVLKDPFQDNPTLRSTKTDSSAPHGLGLLSIQTLVDKYNGSVQQEYQNGRFLSLASFCFEPFDTENNTIQTKALDSNKD